MAMTILAAKKTNNYLFYQQKTVNGITTQLNTEPAAYTEPGSKSTTLI